MALFVNSGIVDLRDLAAGHRWWDRSLPRFLEAAGLERGGEERSQFHPPGSLVVVCPASELDFLNDFRVWMSDAHSIVLVFDCGEETEPKDLLENARAALQSVPLKQILLWSGQADDREAPQRAVALCREVECPDRSPVPTTTARKHKSGPWLPYSGTTLSLPRKVGQTAEQPQYFNFEKKNLTCLRTGEPLGTVGELEQAWMCTPSPQGDQILRRDQTGLAILSLEGVGSSQPAPHGFAVAWAPNVPVAWVGYRCVFHWLYVGTQGVGWMSQCEHDWPCGHAKKQYGYLDNSPLWVHLSANCDAYLSMFEKDAIVSSSVPIRWCQAGGLWAACCAPADDPDRALFFERDEDDGYQPADPGDPLDDDARDERPVLALGPSPELRYSVDLRRPVFRIQGKTSTPLPRFEGYGVFNKSHELVRQGRGGLLAGWGDSIFVQEGLQVYRESVTTAQRSLLVELAEDIDWAFAIPGTCNAVGIQFLGEGEARIRLL